MLFLLFLSFLLSFSTPSLVTACEVTHRDLIQDATRKTIEDTAKDKILSLCLGISACKEDFELSEAYSNNFDLVWKALQKKAPRFMYNVLITTWLSQSQLLSQTEQFVSFFSELAVLIEPYLMLSAQEFTNYTSNLAKHCNTLQKYSLEEIKPDTRLNKYIKIAMQARIFEVSLDSILHPAHRIALSFLLFQEQSSPWLTGAFYCRAPHIIKALTTFMSPDFCSFLEASGGNLDSHVTGIRTTLRLLSIFLTYLNKETEPFSQSVKLRYITHLNDWFRFIQNNQNYSTEHLEHAGIPPCFIAALKALAKLDECAKELGLKPHQSDSVSFFMRNPKEILCGVSLAHAPEAISPITAEMHSPLPQSPHAISPVKAEMSSPLSTTQTPSPLHGLNPHAATFVPRSCQTPTQLLPHYASIASTDGQKLDCYTSGFTPGQPKRIVSV